MSKHDEAIKKAQKEIERSKKEIERLSAEIEKKKAHITELQGQIKQYEAAKAKDAKFSNVMMEIMSNNGIISEEDRNDVLQKMNEYLQSIAARKTETAQTAAENEPATDNNATENTEPDYEPIESIESEETEETETEPTTASTENYRTVPTATPTANYQNSSYPYRTTNNGGYNNS